MSSFVPIAAAASDVFYSSEGILRYWRLAGSWILACQLCPSGPSELLERRVDAPFLLAYLVHVSGYGCSVCSSLDLIH